jgi:hypothetical protein
MALLELKTSQTFEEAAAPAIDTFISNIRSLPVGETFLYQCKSKTLTDEWTNCKAVKQDDHFLVTLYSEDEETRKVYFDDETSSILSPNLWECGWYRQCPSETPPSLMVTKSCLLTYLEVRNYP